MFNDHDQGLSRNLSEVALITTRVSQNRNRNRRNQEVQKEIEARGHSKRCGWARLWTAQCSKQEKQPNKLHKVSGFFSNWGSMYAYKRIFIKMFEGIGEKSGHWLNDFLVYAGSLHLRNQNRSGRWEEMCPSSEMCLHLAGALLLLLLTWTSALTGSHLFCFDWVQKVQKESPNRNSSSEMCLRLAGALLLFLLKWTSALTGSHLFCQLSFWKPLPRQLIRL